MSNSTKNYYDILGILPSESMYGIKRAWRAKARKYHPDLNPDDEDAPARFRELQEAYACLRDPKLRTAYDHSIGLRGAVWTSAPPPDREEEDLLGDDILKATAKTSGECGRRGGLSEAARAAAEEMKERLRRSKQKQSAKEEKGSAPSPGQDSTSAKRGQSFTAPSFQQAASDPENRRSSGSRSYKKGNVFRKRSARHFRRGSHSGANQRKDTVGSRNDANEQRKSAKEKEKSLQERPKRLLMIVALFTAWLLAFVGLLIDPQRAIFFGILGMGLTILRRLDELEHKVQTSEPN